LEENTEVKYEKSSEITEQKTNKDNILKRKQALNEQIMQVISELDMEKGIKQEISKGFYEIDSKRNKLL